jgi:hypothetical protein
VELNRRQLARILAAGSAAATRLYSQTVPAPAWTPEWDRTLIEAAVAQQDRNFDSKENMLQSHRGADYNYHSALRNAIVHPTRDSVGYALVLLEAGGAERIARAAAVLDRTIALQDTDPKSRFYGIWGYFLEEPPAQMQPADFNWADFNGAQLLMIEARHGGKLPPATRARVADSIRHAANSIRRRNVTMAYTNIAVQGTFVTLAAAELLKDDDLRAYAHDRLHRFAQQVDLTGSFDEYNSPTYIQVTIGNLTRIRMLLKEDAVLQLAARIEERAWRHIGEHWHAATRQLAGPMSRCYFTDIGSPLWLQKALGGALPFATIEEAKRRPGDADAAILDYRCPAGITPLILKSGEPRQHREIFRIAAPPVIPVQGTTWLDRDWCLGSVNRGNFWVQSRPLVAYWGGPQRPAHYFQARMVKDDYDFSSGLLYSVQDRGWLLGVVTFQTDGGDKHPSIDRVKNGEFTGSRFRLRFDIGGLTATPRVLQDGTGPNSRLALELGGVNLVIQIRKAAMAKFEPRLTWSREDKVFAISFDWFPAAPEPRTIRFKDIGPAYAVLTMAMSGAELGLSDLDAAFAKREYESRDDEFRWGNLAMKARTIPGTLAELDKAFVDATQLVRLSDVKLAG